MDSVTHVESVRDDQRLAKAGYYLRHNEIWARTYAQYIAVRSRDSRLMEQVENNRTDGLESDRYTQLQWSADDFKPIAVAMDVLFESLKWKK